ncbi:MAG: DNA polymerase III subunit beta [Candidatus Acidiferrales bacterium]
MDFFVERSDLVKELNFVRNAVEKRSTIPVLSHFLLEAEGFELRITATDMEVTARTTCQAKVKTKGAAVIPGLRFLEIVRSAASGEIRCRGLENHAVQVTSGRTSFKLVGLAKGDFPTFPTVPEPIARLDAAVLDACVKKTSFAVSEEESRYVLNGALLKLKPDCATMIATDGHRLALAERKSEIANLKEELSVLIPRRALILLPRLSEEDSNGPSVELSKDGSQIYFSLGPRMLASRLLTGQFPNYESVLPKENGKAVDLKPQEFEDVVRRVSLLADERVPGVRLLLEKDRLEVSASSPEYGEARESVETQYGQEALHIGFNAEYLLEFLRAVGAATSIRMQVKDAESAAEFRPSGDETEQYRYILMPLRF